MTSQRELRRGLRGRLGVIKRVYGHAPGEDETRTGGARVAAGPQIRSWRAALAERGDRQQGRRAMLWHKERDEMACGCGRESRARGVAESPGASAPELPTWDPRKGYSLSRACGMRPLDRPLDFVPCAKNGAPCAGAGFSRRAAALCRGVAVSAALPTCSLFNIESVDSKTPGYLRMPQMPSARVMKERPGDMERTRLVTESASDGSPNPQPLRSPSHPDSKVVKYGTSCTGCRKRKQRCDAKLPSCTRCVGLKEGCVYESNIRNNPSPTILPILRKTFVFLESLVAPDSPHPDSSLRLLIREHLKATPLPTFVLHPLDKSRHTEGDEQVEASSSVDGTLSNPAPIAQDEAEKDVGERPVRNGAAGEEECPSEVDELLMHMSLADDGQNDHFGITSLFWQTPSESVVKRLQRRLSRTQHTARDTSSNHADGARVEARLKGEEEVWATEEHGFEGDEEEAGILKSNASMLGAWERLAFHKLELESDPVSATMITESLKLYFCWEYGTHCVVYRPVFIRDMALGGPYFNHFLLNVICANAARYSDAPMGMEGAGPGGRTPVRNSGAEYMNRAKLLLASEMDKPSNVPTIQGLLLLGQRECVCGNLSQGWMYTGMAFRAMRDLGIHLDCSRLPIFGFGTLSVEDKEIRRRLFWSAYTWDKIISLALGRTPTFNAFQNISPGVIVDDTEDDDSWTPYFSGDAFPEEMALYPVQRSLATLNFRHSIKLSEIITKIIMRLYDGRTFRQRNASFVQRMQTRLTDWYAELPSAIKLDTSNLPEHCPPPHIFTTNALYRAAWVLLYRIFLPNALPVRTHALMSITMEAANTCTKMADELHQLSLLYLKSFKLKNMNYTIMWALYSAATINAIDFRSSDAAVSAAAGPRLGMSLHALERGSIQSPGTVRSLEIIKHRLRAPIASVEKRPFDVLDQETSRTEYRGRIALGSPLEEHEDYVNGSASGPATMTDRPIVNRTGPIRHYAASSSNALEHLAQEISPIGQDFTPDPIHGTQLFLPQSAYQNPFSAPQALASSTETFDSWLSRTEIAPLHALDQQVNSDYVGMAGPSGEQGNGSADLLQGMMAMPSNLGTVNDWSGSWEWMPGGIWNA